MKYLKLKFLLIFAALAMAIPPAWAETVTLTLDDFPNLSNSYSSGTITKDGITFNYENFLKSGTSIQVKADFGTLSNETAFSGDITSVAITHSGTGRATTINGSSDGTNWTKVTSGNGSITGDFTGKGYKYFQITRGSNAAYWTKIEITYETGGPSLSVNKNELILKEPNGSFTVTGENLVDNVGVKQNPDGLFNLSFSSNLNWGFERDSENKVNGTVTVSYQGRDLTATGTIIPGTKNAEWTADIEAPVTVTYQPNLYIYCDLIDGQSWRYYPDEPQMTYDDGVYTKTVTITNPGSCILFARAAGLSYSWNDDRMFFGAKYDSDWVYGVDTSMGLGIYGSGNNNQYYPIKFNQAGVYTITINAANNTFSVTSTNVANIAEAQAFEGDTFTFMGNVVVTYQNGDNLWIRDIANRDGEIKSGLIYGDVDVEFANGDIVAPGWQAGNKLYNYYVPEFINPVGVTKGQGSGDGAPIALTTLDRVRDVNKYASISGVTITRVSSPNFYFEVDNTEYCLRDNFDMFDDLEVGHVYNVEGVVSVYSGNPQLWLTDVKEVKVLSVTLESETKTATVGETIPVTVNVANAEGNYTVTYKFGENGTENTLTGNTINVTSETAGDVTLYVTVTNNGNEATASETYTFTEPLTGNNVFTKVKSADQLVAGKKYIIVCGNKAMGSSATGNYLTAIDVTAGDEVQVGDDVAIMTLAGTLGHYTLALGEKYLHATSNAAIGFGTSTEWAISNFNGSLTGFRVKHADFDRAVRYSAGYNRFGNYATSDAASDYGWIYVEKATTPQPEPLAVTLPDAPVEHYKVGQVVKVKATVENGSDNTVLTYKVGDETLTPDNEGNVTLPNKNSGNVELTVTAVDGERTATDSKTYVFDAADELTITLTPATGTYFVGDEQNVTVTVEDAIDANPTITYKFGEEGEAQNYNAETGIVLPTAQAGTINLIVMVDDNGYEHAGATTATGTYTVNHKALTIKLDPESATFTVGADDEPKVKVTIENAVGTPTVTCKVGDETLDLVDGYVTLPDTKAGTVTLTVTARDEREGAQDVVKTGTYTFTPADAISIVFDPVDGTKFNVGQEAVVNFTVEGTIGDDVIEILVNGEKVDDDGSGRITLPNTAAGNVTVTINVTDDYDHDGEDENGVTSATATYKFNAAEAFEITLTNTPDQETYKVNDVVNVKVTVAHALVENPTITYTIGETREATTYNPETGINVTSDKDGTVTLTVNVTDGFEHAGESSKTANYIFEKKDVNLAFGETPATVYVGDEITLTVTGAPEGATVTFECTPENAVTFGENGKVIFNTEGEVTITAKTAATDEYTAGTATCTITVEPKPYVTAEPTKLDFEAVIGNDPVEKTFTVMAENLKGDITLTMTESEVFTITPATIAKADMTEEGVEVTVTYNPTAVTGDDLDEATVTIKSTDAEDVPVTLTGMATLPDPVLNVTPGTLEMGTDPTSTFTVTGQHLTEDVTLTVTEGTAANFVITPANITPDEEGKVNQEITVTYKGTSTTDELATITVASGTAKKEVTVSAHVLPTPVIIADPESLTMTAVVGQTPATATFTVMADDLRGDITLTMSETDVFTIEPATIAKADMTEDGVEVTVTYTPKQAGNDNATITIASEAAESITITLNGTATVPEVVAAPTFSLVAGSYTGAQTVTISCATESATILYSTDGGSTWTAGNTVNVDKDMTIMAKAEKDGYTNSATVTAAYIIDIPEELPTITPFKGYYQIKNNGNNKYANIAGRKTLNFTDAPADKAGTVIWLETNDKGQVQSIRSQAADLQGYANRAMNYVPDIVELVADKLNADGEGLLLGHEGLKKIMEKFNESFDHHLYVEQAEGGWRLYGKTPSMQPVVDFYRENTAQVEAKLPMLEDFINSALDKLKEKIGGSSVFTPFSLHQIWENMGETLTEPNDAESTMAFYREVLNNKNYVWDFAYQTAMIYVNNLKNHPRYDEVEDMLGEYAQYINMIEQVRPDFKYYIVQKNDKPDFISEGNVDITKNAARTIWTLEPRTEFNVSIAENLFGCPLAGGVGGYATTLYTDFAYSVPDGVTAYKVTSIEGGNATIEAQSGVIPAQTPVMLTAKEAGTATLTLSTEAGTAVTGNLLVGPDYLINEYKLTTPIVENIFNIVKEKLGQSFYDAYVAQYEHLMYLNSGTVNNKYFWGLKQEDIAKCGTTDEYDRVQCVVRSLEGGKFIDNMKVETNKAFLVTDEYAEITLNNLRGDVNHDGIVNIKDVTDLIDRLLEIPDPEHLVACEYCSDVNQNGAVNIQDVTVLIDILLGNTTSAEGGGN